MISIQAKIDSLDLKVLKNYARTLPARTLIKLHRILLSTALDVEGDAKESIMKGNPSGTISRRGKSKGASRKKGLGRRTLIHQASAPGEPPASDTGQLANSIMHREYQRKKTMKVSVGSVVKHGLFTEEGTKKMAKRPWLVPAIEASRPSLERKVIELARSTGAI